MRRIRVRQPNTTRLESMRSSGPAMSGNGMRNTALDDRNKDDDDNIRSAAEPSGSGELRGRHSSGRGAKRARERLEIDKTWGDIMTRGGKVWQKPQAPQRLAAVWRGGVRTSLVRRWHRHRRACMNHVSCSI